MPKSKYANANWATKLGLRVKLELSKRKAAKAAKRLKEEENRNTTSRTRAVSQGLRSAGITDAEIQRLRGGRRN